VLGIPLENSGITAMWGEFQNKLIIRVLLYDQYLARMD
jgi:hypothetical protein